ncbi:MAG: hypothetical protein OEM38_02895 [Gammaproteobacteria bacterium]|nr:hypothetical protein [Gammaproteobacteria bacterium]
MILKPSYKTIIIFCLLTLFVSRGGVAAKVKENGWVFSPVVGVNHLALDVFYDSVYNAPFVGTVEITTDLPEDVEGTSSYPIEPFAFENDLIPRAINVEGGLEMRRYFGTRNDFFIGIGAWETNSENAPIRVRFPMQGDRINLAEYARRSKLSFTQYYLGIRHYLTRRENKFNAYLNISIREIFDIDYEETNVFSFISGPPAGFKRIFVYKSQATGFLMMQFGVGGEYRFAERFSIAMEGAYAFHLQAGALRGVAVEDDTNDGDRIRLPPLIIRPINPLQEAGALNKDGVTRTKVELRLDGWHVLAKFNVAF